MCRFAQIRRGGFAAEVFGHSLEVDFPAELLEKLPVDKRKYRRLKLSWMLGLEVALALLIAFFL